MHLRLNQVLVNVRSAQCNCAGGTIDMQDEKSSNRRKKKLIWRISNEAPLGEFIDPDAEVPPVSPKSPDTAQPGWAISSFELMRGVDISEDPETVPADLFDQLFRKP